MLNCWRLLGVISVLILNVNSLGRNELVKEQDKEVFYLLRTRENTIHQFPDPTTLKYYGFDGSKVQVVSSISSQQQWKLVDPIKPVKVPYPNPDLGVEYMLQRVHNLYPQNFWRGNYCIKMFNPSIARWKGRWIVAYRNDSSISFAWMRHVEDKEDPAKFRLEPIFEDNQFGLRNPNGNHPWNKTLSWDTFREDPRLLVRHKDSVLSLTFIRLRARWDTANIAYIDLHVSEEHKIGFGSTIWLQSSGKQKNWMPFEYKDDQYWIKSVNPLEIVKANELSLGDGCYIAKLEYVSQSSTEVVLPWLSDYGLPIRGGTPAILVKGVYLAFFHTLSSFNKQFGMETYFMGAITFCPDPPFHVHTMSPHPILLDGLYQGMWHNTHRDYVVFPGGIAVDDQEEYLFMSYGHQDGNGFVGKFDVKELLDSLELVSPCHRQ